MNNGKIREQGFTLIGLLVVIAISAILAAVLLPPLLHALTAGYRPPARTPAADEVTQPARANAMPAKEVSEKESNSDWNFLKGFVPAYNRVWTSPPLVETADT